MPVAALPASSWSGYPVRNSRKRIPAPTASPVAVRSCAHPSIRTGTRSDGRGDRLGEFRFGPGLARPASRRPCSPCRARASVRSAMNPRRSPCTVSDWPGCSLERRRELPERVLDSGQFGVVGGHRRRKQEFGALGARAVPERAGVVHVLLDGAHGLGGLLVEGGQEEVAGFLLLLAAQGDRPEGDAVDRARGLRVRWWRSRSRLRPGRSRRRGRSTTRRGGTRPR